MKLFFPLLFLFVHQFIVAQLCNEVQNLSTLQENQINSIANQIEIELVNEDLYKIDSLSYELKLVFSSQAGKPEILEYFRAISPINSWISELSALEISRNLISNDSLVYVNLWKTARGLKPPLYQDNSILLRTSAEQALGLLKIADHETDANRRNLYRSWAKKTLDSLLTKQLPNGAFPFPDLREYNDPVFSTIIQNFINSCGADSINVLQNGWIIDDKSSGEFKFDAGIIANAFYEAFYYLGDNNYRNAVLAVGDYLKNLNYNLNYNYNSFSCIGLTRAFQLTNDFTYLEKALDNIRFSIYPGQIENGRWMDGHNASSRYHSIIIQNIAPIINLIPGNSNYKSKIDSMYFLAVQNSLDQTFSCGSATAYKWLFKSYVNTNQLFSEGFNDSIYLLIA